MHKTIAKAGRHTLIVLLEFLAVAIVLAALAFAAFFWRMNQGPMSLGFAKDYVEQSLSDGDEGVSVTFDDIVLTWPDVQKPFYLDLSGLKVAKGKRAVDSLSIDHARVGLARTALLFGIIRPVSVIIKSPSLELVRTADGHFNLFVADKQVAAQPAGPRQKPGEEIAAIFKDMAGHRRGSLFSRLDDFEIQGASVAIRDYQFGLSWYLSDLDFALFDLPQGVALTLKVPLSGGQEAASAINVAMAYRKKTDDFRTSVHVERVNPYILSRFVSLPANLGGQDLFLSGDLDAAFDSKLVPTQGKFTGIIPQGIISLPEDFDKALPIKNIRLDADFNDASDALNFSNLSGEIGGIAFKGNGHGRFGEQSFDLPIELSVAKAQLGLISPLFPKSEQDGDAYLWLGHRMDKGSFTNVKLAMTLTGDKTRDEALQRDEWQIKVPKLLMTAAFSGMNVDYNSKLMPVRNASGTGTLDLAAETLDIRGDHAEVGDLVGSDTHIAVSDLMKPHGGYLKLSTAVRGPLATTLSFLSAEPIGMTKEKIGLDPATARGTVDVRVDLAMPTVTDVPKDQVKVDIAGSLSDLTVPNAVKGLTLSGGPLNIATEPGGFHLDGTGQLDGRDVALDWRQFFEAAGHPYSIQVRARIGADQDLRHAFGIGLDHYIAGTLPVEVVYTDHGGGDADLAANGDLSPVALTIPPFRFVKEAGIPGKLDLKATLKKGELAEIHAFGLQSKNLDFKNVTLGFGTLNGKTGELLKGEAPDLTIGQTKLTATFATDAKGVMNVTATGSQFDLAPFLKGSEKTVGPTAPPEKQQPLTITLQTKKMLGKSNQTILNPRLFLKTDADGDVTQFEMDGVSGKSPLSVRFKPDASGQRVFRLRTDDAGAVLYTLGLYDNMVGGTMLAYGAPKRGDKLGNLFGTARLENFKIVRAPGLARLLSLMSLKGVGDLLNNQGIAFSKLETPFEWRFRNEGNLLILKDGKTSGSSIGLTFEGVIDRGAGTTDVSGTVIPMTEVNSLLAKIPLIGDLLGGSGGLIAATYSMKGPSDDPKVTLNPLSVLAPGFLRKILFENGYESKIPDDDAPAQPSGKPH